jgi:tRNA-2-methylthio-N6-dimethylallyladenosine synthase
MSPDRRIDQLFIPICIPMEQRMRSLNKFFVRTYGCQMNELDTEIMVGQLESRGLTRTENEGDADLLIFNTCSIRDLAERKVMGKIGLLGTEKNPTSQIIGVTGCMANAKKDSLFQKLPRIDFVMGTNNIHELNNVLDEVLATGKPIIRTDDMFVHELDYLGAVRNEKVVANVSIIRGCDKFCTYCVVPYTRGPEVSRDPKSIVEECQQLVNNGYREVMLLGQNVNSYGKDKPEWSCLFHDLLYQLDKIPRLERIRFMTSHPVDITRELMEATRDLKSVCEFVHFPIQSGSNRILKKMHRIYTVEQYLEKVALFRELVPDVTLGTDIIVGFPTETEAEFEETYQILKQLEYSVAFIFAYSPRKGTPAMRWKDDIPEEVKQDRLQRLIALQEEISAKQRQAFLGKEVEVLVEKKNFKDDTRLKGRTRCWKNVLFQGDDQLIGTLQRVRIHSYSHQTLIGTLIP